MTARCRLSPARFDTAVTGILCSSKYGAHISRIAGSPSTITTWRVLAISGPKLKSGMLLMFSVTMVVESRHELNVSHNISQGSMLCVCVYQHNLVSLRRDRRRSFQQTLAIYL